MNGSVSHSRKVIRRALYQLKFRYGYPVTFYKVIKADFDPQTGLTPYTLESIRVARCIVMPSEIQRNFFFSISVIQANSRFIQGGDVNLQDRQIIVDGSDLPLNWFYDDINGYFIWEHQRYDIKVITNLEYSTGWVMTGRKVQGAVNQEVHNLQLEDYIPPFDSYTTS